MSAEVEGIFFFTYIYVYRYFGSASSDVRNRFVEEEGVKKDFALLLAVDLFFFFGRLCTHSSQPIYRETSST